jgi:RNA polymerase sigma-70 factor (ECF subfamily)
MTAAVLERIASGDATAFSLCVDQHGDMIWSLARRFSSTAADAEDAVQEIFLHLWKAAGRYDAARGSEAVFIATLARRLLIDRYRARRRRPIEVAIDENDPAFEYHTETAALSSDAQRAADALGRLRPEQQQVIGLSVVRGLSQAEIATATGMPLGTVKTLMRRGFLELRELLGSGFSP